MTKLKRLLVPVLVQLCHCTGCPRPRSASCVATGRPPACTSTGVCSSVCISVGMIASCAGREHVCTAPSRVAHSQEQGACRYGPQLGAPQCHALSVLQPGLVLSCLTQRQSRTRWAWWPSMWAAMLRRAPPSCRQRLRRPRHSAAQRAPQAHLHEHGQGAAHAEVVGGDGHPAARGAHNDAAKPLPHVAQAGGHSQDGHDLCGRRGPRAAAVNSQQRVQLNRLGKWGGLRSADALQVGAREWQPSVAAAAQLGRKWPSPGRLRAFTAARRAARGCGPSPEATAMSKPVCRVMPFSAGPCPMVMPRRKRSLVSSTRRQVMESAWVGSKVCGPWGGWAAGQGLNMNAGPCALVLHQAVGQAAQLASVTTALGCWPSPLALNPAGCQHGCSAQPA